MSGAAISPSTSQSTGSGGFDRSRRGYGICGTRAALWLIEYHNGASRISLSYWRPKATGAEDQFQLSVTRGSASHVISTVKSGSPTGSGRSTFRPTATGGRFEVSGKAGDGAPLQVTIECARFGGITAEGG